MKLVGIQAIGLSPDRQRDSIEIDAAGYLSKLRKLMHKPPILTAYIQSTSAQASSMPRCASRWHAG